MYEGQLQPHILPTLGRFPLARMTTSGVRRWHAALLAGGVGSSTAAKCCRLLWAILNTAVEDRHLVANPCTIKGAGIEQCDERPVPTIAEVYAPPWALRANLVIADAVYVVLAVRLGAPLLTDDQKLAKAPTLPPGLRILTVPTTL